MLFWRIYLIFFYNYKFVGIPIFVVFFFLLLQISYYYYCIIMSSANVSYPGLQHSTLEGHINLDFDQSETTRIE